VLRKPAHRKGILAKNIAEEREAAPLSIKEIKGERGVLHCPRSQTVKKTQKK